ncbi:MAG: preprotein translocase subunit SecG [Bacteroidales bacterium]|nr:preprotein translocase subunit SecG [Bacteroidales bacterium]
MYVAISVFILIVSALMMVVVLVQNSKGGGLVSNLSSSNQILGVRKTTDFLEKATWTLAIILVVLCLVSSIALPKGSVGAGSSVDTEMRQQIENTMAPSDYQMPAADAE